MNHLESSFTGKNSLWRYIVMFAAVLVASNTIGALPLLIAYATKASADPEVISEIAANPDDLSVLGLDPNMGLFMMLFPFLIGLLTFILLVKPLNNRTFKMTINGTGRVRWDRFFVSFLVWLILSVLYFFINLKADPSNFKLGNVSETLIFLTVISFLFIPFQAAFEEVLFRGYLMQGLSAMTRNRWFPLLMTSNIFLCIMVTHESSALQTPAVYEQQVVYPFIELAALFITGIIFIVVLKMIFKWDNFPILLGTVEAKPQDVQSPYTDVFSSLR
jgi:uncharacterized protein